MVDWVERFKTLSPEQRLTFIQPQLDLYIAAVGKKASISPQIATIAAALIAITTLNPETAYLNPFEGKVFLAIFLLVIPTSLFMYVWEQRKAAENALTVIGSYQGKTLEEMVTQFNTKFPKHQKIFNWAWSRKEEIMIFIVFLVIIYVLVQMWYPFFL
ncbi:MAG: hypothetical protein WCT45_02370 [Candidatus Paceibacterota bacterium]|jgi:hypothetical protein